MTIKIVKDVKDVKKTLLKGLKRGYTLSFSNGETAVVKRFIKSPDKKNYYIHFDRPVVGIKGFPSDDNHAYSVDGMFSWKPGVVRPDGCNDIVDVSPTKIKTTDEGSAPEAFKFIERFFESICSSEETSKTKKAKRWKPSEGEDYYVISDDGRVCSCTNRYTDITEGSYSLGLVYKTKGEAQEALEIRQATVKLLDLCNPDGNIELSYHADVKDFVVVGEDGIKKDDRSIIMSPYHFSTRADARKALKEIGTRMLKKIYNISC